MLVIQFLVAVLSFVTLTHAHGEPSTPFANHPVEVGRRQLEMNKRHVMARNCAPQVAEYQRHRKAKRALRRRSVDIEKRNRSMECVDPSTATDVPASTESSSTVDTIVTDPPESSDTSTSTFGGSSTMSAIPPHYSTIQNFTCVTAPEVTEGPYYLRDDYVRQDLREDQNGTSLFLDIGVLDITTCQPAQDVLVEIWACNAQGSYSAFGNGQGGGGAPPNGTQTLSIPTGTFSRPPPPTGSGGGGGGGGGAPPQSGKANGFNFLRGGWPSDENGMVELVTIYPGFYTGRTVHIHTMVHQNISYHSNGTIISSSGGVRHIGQIFFDEALNTEVLAQPAYQGSGQQHTYNSQDGILAQANSGGYSAFADIERLGESLDDGLLGYITIGIDSSASYNISTTNYWDPNFGSEIAD